jgi:hypothetical protein
MSYAASMETPQFGGESGGTSGGLLEAGDKILNNSITLYSWTELCNRITQDANNYGEVLPTVGICLRRCMLCCN